MTRFGILFEYFKVTLTMFADEWARGLVTTIVGLRVDAEIYQSNP